MSIGLVLAQTNVAVLDDIEAFLAHRNKRCDDQNSKSLEIQGELVEVLHFLLTGSSDFVAAWFDNSEPSIKELPLPESGKCLILVDALASGVWLKPSDACYLTPDKVQDITQALSRLSQENLETRWDSLNEFYSSNRRRVIGDLERLQSSTQKLEQVVWDVSEFTDYFINEVVAYYVDTSRKGMGLIITDCT